MFDLFADAFYLLVIQSARTGLDASLQVLLKTIFAALDVVHDGVLEEDETKEFFEFTRKIDVRGDQQVLGLTTKWRLVVFATHTY